MLFIFGLLVSTAALFIALLYIWINAKKLAKKAEGVKYGPEEPDTNKPCKLAVMEAELRNLRNPYSGRNPFHGSAKYITPILASIVFIILHRFSLNNLSFSQIAIVSLILFIFAFLTACKLSNMLDIYLCKRKISMFKLSHKGLKNL